MDFSIGKVFSDSIVHKQGPSSRVTTRYYPRDSGGESDVLQAARIRADTAEKDRLRKERTSDRALDIREGDLARKTVQDERLAKIREVAARAELELRGVKSWQDGVRIVERIMRSARAKDAYGRVDKEQVKLYSDLLEQVKTHLLAPPAQGGLGLPPGDLLGKITEAQRELAGPAEAGNEVTMADLGGRVQAGNEFSDAIGATKPAAARVAPAPTPARGAQVAGMADIGNAGLTAGPGMADTAGAQAPAPGMGPMDFGDLTPDFPGRTKPARTP